MLRSVSPRTALIAGSTGLVGRVLLQYLLDAPEYTRVLALGRRAPSSATSASGQGKLEVLRTDFTDLSVLGERLAADDVYCCLGSTRAVAGSRVAFEQIDRHYVVALARAARTAGARRFMVVSAAGSSLHSPSFYSRVKARMEQDVAALGYPVVEILRPSLLLGARQQTRPGEQAAQRLAPALAPLLPGPLRRYRPVSAAQVAQAMLELARQDRPGVHIHHFPLEPHA